MNGKNILADIEKKYPWLKRNYHDPINRNIFFYNSLFTNQENILVTSLIQNPFGINKAVEKKGKNLGLEIIDNLKILNQLHNKDKNFLRNYNEFKQLINLFLIDYKVAMSKNPQKAKKWGMLKKDKLLYLKDLVEKNDISAIREGLEDMVFSKLKPGLFRNYISLLKYSKNTYKNNDIKIKNKIRNLMHRHKIEGRIHSRFKSIYSVHKKITKKNILYSQVLDIIGIRIILKNEVDCYKLMELIINKWTVIHSKIKDFIAVPKENGYQSIHLTIIYNNHPIEIQIRTFKMHKIAQFGQASHLSYKGSLVHK
ncbi:MAG: hypothetical protein GF335_03015 [Candidatus Moranbacteria bacterium]|nr:hypothetical protein [Candidatus Moranbacteria bacterium]